MIQGACEDYRATLLEDVHLCVQYARRVTVMSRDMMLTRRIRSLVDPGNSRQQLGLF